MDLSTLPPLSCGEWAILGLVNFAIAAILLVIAASLVGCSGRVTGTYTAPNGAMTLELKYGGDASVTFAGQTAPCKYTVSGSTLSLTCQGQSGAMNFTIQKDGSLAGPPDSFFPPLVKK